MSMPSKYLVTGLQKHFHDLVRKMHENKKIICGTELLFKAQFSFK